MCGSRFYVVTTWFGHHDIKSHLFFYLSGSPIKPNATHSVLYLAWNRMMPPFSVLHWTCWIQLFEKIYFPCQMIRKHAEREKGNIYFSFVL
jgi:hypothetical protein